MYIINYIVTKIKFNKYYFITLIIIKKKKYKTKF